MGKRGIVMPIIFRRKGDYCSRLSLLNLFEIKLRKKTPTKPHEIMIEKHKMAMWMGLQLIIYQGFQY